MPAKAPVIEDDDIPEYARRCYQRYKNEMRDVLEAESESIGFYIGGRHQWRANELARREGKKRPWTTINRCKPVVDQIVNESTSNPPGPEADPVGGGADQDSADIIEGLIREYEYRSNANQARNQAMLYACAGGRGLWEMSTEYVDQRSMEQQITIKFVSDPSNYFHDIWAQLPSKADSNWAGKIMKLDRQTLIQNYGDGLKVLNRSALEKFATKAGAWIAEATGWNSGTSMAEWTGSQQDGNGPFYVCEFWMVKVVQKELRLYTDNIMHFEDEQLPKGVKPVEGDEHKRMEPFTEVWKYVITALDVIEKTKWPGTIIPYFWIMGPELYKDKKLTRLSAITNAQPPQRSLNFAATSIDEITGAMTKSPWIGYAEQFQWQNAQGKKPWDTANSEMYPYLPIKEHWLVSEAGTEAPAPPPQRIQWEVPMLNQLVETATWFGEAIKAATAVFFEPSLASAKQAQSGEAIKALQAQTNIGSGNWQEARNNTVQLEYWQASIIFPKLYDGERVRTIVRPDTTHEMMTINRDFPEDHVIDHATGKYRDPKGKLQPSNNIMYGKFNLRVNVGPSEKTRTTESIVKIIDAAKVMPSILGNPPAQAKLVRMIGEGNPDVESFADSISPPPDSDISPEQMQQQIQKQQQVIQLGHNLITQLQQKLDAKLPQVEADERKNIRDNLTRLEVAKITASKDLDSQQADILAAQYEQMLEQAHEFGMQKEEHEHAAQQTQVQHQQALQQGDHATANALVTNQQQADLAPEPAEGGE